MKEIKLEVGKYYKSKDHRRIVKVIEFNKNSEYPMITIDHIISSGKITRNCWFEFCKTLEEISKKEALKYLI